MTEQNREEVSVDSLELRVAPANWAHPKRKDGLHGFESIAISDMPNVNGMKKTKVALYLKSGGVPVTNFYNSCEALTATLEVSYATLEKKIGVFLYGTKEQWLTVLKRNKPIYITDNGLTKAYAEVLLTKKLILDEELFYTREGIPMGCLSIKSFQVRLPANGGCVSGDDGQQVTAYRVSYNIRKQIEHTDIDIWINSKSRYYGDSSHASDAFKEILSANVDDPSMLNIDCTPYTHEDMIKMLINKHILGQHNTKHPEKRIHISEYLVGSC